MPPFLPALLLALFWLSIHAVHRFVLPLFLPYALPPPASLTRRRPLPLPLPSWLDPSRTSITLSWASLKIETRAFNPPHDRFTSYLDKKGWVWAGRLVYDIGILVGLLGVFSSLGMLLWTASVLLVEGFQRTPDAPRLMKRFVDQLADSALMHPKTTLALRPLIPGITIPLSHLPLMLSALFICQSLHELGHAIAAALESTPLHSVGLALHVIVPTAFVSLSASAAHTNPRASLRLACAGALHNILIWLAFYGVAHSGLGSLATRIGWEDVSELGKVVMGFNDETSELTRYIPRGALITKLDDTPVGISLPAHHGALGDPDPWEHFLLARTTPHIMGWCIDSALYAAQPTACCYDPTSTPALSCFLPSPHTPSTPSTPPPAGQGQGHCLTPLTLFNRTSPTPARCPTTSACTADQTCIYPSPEARLLRITWVDMDRGWERVVLWKGPRSEVYRQVRVGNVLPRFSIIPFWLPDVVQLFITYNLSVTLALYLFNLLPLPYLDGGQVLASVLDIVFPGSDPGMRAGMRGKVERGVHWAVGGLAGGVGLGVVLKEVFI